MIHYEGGSILLVIDKPYVSPILAETAKRLNIPVYQSGDVFLPNKDQHNLQQHDTFFQHWVEKRAPLLANSENAFQTVEKATKGHDLAQWIHLFKDKLQFRRSLASRFPHFFFQEVLLHDLKTFDYRHLPFPIVVKPSIGYSSLGVFRIANETEWPNKMQLLEDEMEKAKTIFPEGVIDQSTFIIEQWIEGTEYAADAYFDENGQPNILNVFCHMFASEDDTSDRIYYTNREVIQTTLKRIERFLSSMGAAYHLKNFPLHFEFRLSDEGIVPIEINPLRFAGIGTTDLGYYAYGINMYQHLFQQTAPDWDRILSSMDDHTYSFFCAELPMNVSYEDVASIHEESLKQQFEEVLEYRSTLTPDDKTFAVIFYRSQDGAENKALMNLSLEAFIEQREVVTL